MSRKGIMARAKNMAWKGMSFEGKHFSGPKSFPTASAPPINAVFGIWMDMLFVLASRFGFWGPFRESIVSNATLHFFGRSSSGDLLPPSPPPSLSVFGSRSSSNFFLVVTSSSSSSPRCDSDLLLTPASQWMSDNQTVIESACAQKRSDFNNSLLLAFAVSNMYCKY